MLFVVADLLLLATITMMISIIIIMHVEEFNFECEEGLERTEVELIER
jgi:hypothetical protein